jgi:hypothetical protein
LVGRRDFTAEGQEETVAELRLGEGFGEEGGVVAEDLGSGDNGGLEVAVVVVVVWSVKLCFWFCVWHRIGGKWLLGNGNTCFITGAKILGRPCEVLKCLGATPREFLSLQ